MTQNTNRGSLSIWDEAKRVDLYRKGRWTLLQLT